MKALTSKAIREAGLLKYHPYTAKYICGFKYICFYTPSGWYVSFKDSGLPDCLWGPMTKRAAKAFAWKKAFDSVSN